MKVNKLFVFIFILFTVVSNNIFSQDKESEPLDSLLMDLEKRYDVVFNYADANVAGIFVTPPRRNLGLDACLLELKRQTGLIFKKIDSRYIAIRRKSPTIKVSGTIIDQSTGEKLATAVVYSGSNYEVSDENGFFSIELNPEKDSVLSFRHVGYHPRYLKRNDWDTDTSVFEMAIRIRTLEEVRLDYIARGISKLLDGTILLNVQNIEVLPGLTTPDVLHIVQILPGIHSMNETVSEINTRGGTNDQNLVLWDGVKMYQTGHFFGLISAFNSNLIHQAKIIKNGTSASYDEGISGVIDMQQQDYPVNDFEFCAGLDMLGADIIAKLPLNKKLSLILGARHSINQIVKTPTYKSYYKRAFEHTEIMLTQPGTDTTVDRYHDFSFYDVSARLMYNISEKDKIRFSVLNNRNSIEFEELATIRDTVYTRESYLQQLNLLSNMSYTRSWTENHSTEMSGFVSYYHLDGSNVSNSDLLFHLQENEVLDWGLKLESRSKIHRAAELLGGYQFREVGIRNLDNIRNPGYSRDEKDVLRIHSLYAETELNELVRNAYLRVGLRTNYFSQFNSFSFEPRTVFSYKLSEHFSLEVLAEKKSQTTTQLIDFQTDFLGIEKRRWVLANNESVPLMKSVQLSAGMQYSGNNFLISMEGYKKNVSGIISPSQGFQNQYEYVYAIGAYSAHGMELLVNKRFTRSNIWVNYTLAKNDYYFVEFTPSVFPNNLDVRHALSLGGSYTLKSIEVSAGFNYRTGRPYTQPVQDHLNERNEIVYEEANSSRLSDYARLDLSAKYTLEIKEVKAEIGISLWNVLNRHNVYNIFYQVNRNQEIEQITQHTLGFTPNISLRFCL
ncbi:MAG: TonB-dependent receptor plug domain-containing protein [Bacteroidales bacterium]